ncbi:MAG: hypothetical protein A3K10_11925 [Bacteroidetes bacterium RIFCSPLOWO2_12_FULL_31_6]|nr:MAG: hypothetical protein A3K10_11925 [Bacteroidetes bacterium RIFCSPLOWO2_12_FULL_31_6]
MIGGGIENNVPLIAEFMPARWGYEGVIVDTYVNNEYGKKFYNLEKKESVCSYKQSYHIPLLKELLNECKDAKTNSFGIKTVLVIKNLEIIKNEIVKENKINKAVRFPSPERISMENFNIALSNEIETYFENLNSFYSITFVGISLQKEVIYVEMDNKNPEILRVLRSNYYNNNLNEILTNSMLKKKLIVLANNTVMQKINPIYLLPAKTKFITLWTHFYAPKKYLFGKLIDTFWFNVMVLWAYSIILFIFLYFNILKQTMSIVTLMKTFLKSKN